jgi:8-oxo-dGTP diphosphatase
MRVVAKVVLVREGKVLLLRRSETDKRRPLQWDLPGGMVENGEDLNTAAARETQEESGITVDPLKLNLVYTDNKMTEKGYVIWLFFAEKTTEEKTVLSFEHTESIWVTPNEALEMIEYPLHKALFAHLQEAQLLQELGLLQ